MRPGYDACWLTNGVLDSDHLAHEADIFSTASQKGKKKVEHQSDQETI